MGTWRAVPGYEGRYEVSADGTVRSLDRLDAAGRPIHGRVLRMHVAKAGYPTVQLHNGTQSTHTVHALVCEAFHGPRPFPAAEVRHLNGDPADNRAQNLRWGTKSENNLDRVSHGTHHNAAKTHCKHGHEFTEANTYVYRGGRHCRACHSIRTTRPRKQEVR